MRMWTSRVLREWQRRSLCSRSLATLSTIEVDERDQGRIYGRGTLDVPRVEMQTGRYGNHHPPFTASDTEGV